MTKAELAAARHISAASADRLIRRHGWRKQPGNDGRVRVLVPRTWVELQRESLDQPVTQLPGTAVSPTDIREALSALQAAITVLREQQEAERSGWREDRMRLLEEIRDLRTERDQAVFDLRTECDRSTAERERMRILLEQAEQGREAERRRTEGLSEQVTLLQHVTAEATAVVELAIQAVQTVRRQEKRAISLPMGWLAWVRAALSS